MMEHTLITIGRQFGSGGHEVGNRLAERLDIPLYDHNLLRMAARELGVSDEDVAKVDETMLGRFLSGYVAGSGEYTAFMSGEEAGRPLWISDYDENDRKRHGGTYGAISKCPF